MPEIEAKYFVILVCYLKSKVHNRDVNSSTQEARNTYHYTARRRFWYLRTGNTTVKEMDKQ